ncbi:MAG: OsmC family protein [Deltaproteobacteria bacterium]|nr:OsmC family protein [Deltaproteobacteria bacterium]MBW2421104.1 OsmC family protein [Deltaproteobacteria bacterium]
MVRMDAVYEGDLHTSSRHGPSGAELATDAPVDNQGRGESFSPTDLLVTALGSCMMTIMGIAARDRGWAMEGARVSLEKHMGEAPRRVARIVVRFDMPGGLPAEARGVLEEAARGCPVCRSLHPDIEIDRCFVWD